MKQKLILVLVIAFLMSACSPETGIAIKEPWARSAAQGGTGAVYFIIQNHSSETDELIGAGSDVAEAVEIHESRMSGDVMQMRQLESVSLVPGAEVVFEPGGVHIMLIGLKQDLEVGDEIEVTLQFRDFEDMTLRVPVHDMPGQEGNH